MENILKKTDNPIDEEWIKSITEHDQEYKRVRDRLIILKTFNQFPECPIPVYQDENKALEILKSDLKTLEESINLLEPHYINLDSDLLSVKYINGNPMIIQAKEINQTAIEHFYTLKFIDSGIKDERFFLEQEKKGIESFNADIIGEFPVLQYWICFLKQKNKKIDTEIDTYDLLSSPFIKYIIQSKLKRKASMDVDDFIDGLNKDYNLWLEKLSLRDEDLKKKSINHARSNFKELLKAIEYENDIHFKDRKKKTVIDLYDKTTIENLINIEELKLIETKDVSKTFDFDKELAQISESDNQFWKGLPMIKVVEHFKIMTESKNKNKEPYLTQQQFISFLKRGFLCDTNQPIQKINCSAGEKGLIINRFYSLYSLAVSQYSHVSKKESFIKLFVNCFDNWDEQTVRPFFKPNKTKEKW